MENIEYIESYFKGISSEDQKHQFEKKILEDSSFAEEVAFYISVNGIIQQQLQQEKKQRFREMYEQQADQQQKVVSIKQPVKYIWRYLAAASVIAAVGLLSWFFFSDKTSTKQLADNYIHQNFQTLSVTMGDQDSLQTGIDLYNSDKPTKALAIFETLAKNDPANSNLKKYAGIVSLRLKNYDKAIRYFTMLEADTSLESNFGKFYKAITLLKRNKIGDKKAAKLLLHQVIDNDLEGKSEAVEWLKEF